MQILFLRLSDIFLWTCIDFHYLPYISSVLPMLTQRRKLVFRWTVTQNFVCRKTWLSTLLHETFYHESTFISFPPICTQTIRKNSSHGVRTTIDTYFITHDESSECKIQLQLTLFLQCVLKDLMYILRGTFLWYVQLVNVFYGMDQRWLHFCVIEYSTCQK